MASKKNGRKNSKRKISRTRKAVKSIGQSVKGKISKAVKGATRNIRARVGKRTYTVRELASKPHRTIKTFLPDLESHAKEIDTLKGKGDVWGAEIYGYKTYQLFPSIRDLAGKLGTYKGLQDEQPEKALHNIKIIRVRRDELNTWINEKKKQVAATKEARVQRGRKSQKFKRQQAKKLRNAQKRISTLLKENRKLKNAAKKKPTKVKKLKKKLKKKSRKRKGN